MKCPHCHKNIPELEKTMYLIEHANGKRRRITVPASWKVTFGPCVAGKEKSTFKMPMALRFYENDTKQRAIFTDVTSFRDMSIKIEEEKINIQEKDGFVECEGKRKSMTFQATSREWIDPDIQKQNTAPALPTDESIFGDNL